MVRFVHKEQPEITMDYVNMPEESARKDALKRCSGEDGGVTAAAPEKKLYRLVAVSFGLLCVLQAALNISLRLALYSSQSKTPEACKNLIEETDKLKEKLINFNHLFQQGWVYFHPSFYYISSTKKSWNDSREDCLQRGADLIVINSKEEQDFTRKFNKVMWIGLTDRETKGMWIWVDGTPLDKSYWGWFEPNNRGNEDCAESKNSWNDESCNSKRYWICESKWAY
ncbi:CD209 antigen-like protein E [Morone saxatilis]|uniref:CD209 antigen-like protein E n=1 Tax=Morone saxatilis TaxID=34816 RepID=UPI0015E1E879|nr:CD209 antigen-like protein E [Morone saxatilis]